MLLHILQDERSCCCNTTQHTTCTRSAEHKAEQSEQAGTKRSDRNEHRHHTLSPHAGARHTYQATARPCRRYSESPCGTTTFCFRPYRAPNHYYYRITGSSWQRSCFIPRVCFLSAAVRSQRVPFRAFPRFERLHCSGHRYGFVLRETDVFAVVLNNARRGQGLG